MPRSKSKLQVNVKTKVDVKIKIKVNVNMKPKIKAIFNDEVELNPKGHRIKIKGFSRNRPRSRSNQVQAKE